ncbi:MAG: phosphate signaling complex protein PhoU [Akkermansiaceae bacterium]|nr:phosphate signaling complex protein PhoU [Akkermansiaceae bacterium]NNM31199.1 phosphate signaling complex protein PhoU [Akkermansiaceae bacterium]
MDETPHTLKDFDSGLARLRDEVVAMANVAIQNLEESMSGLMEGNRDKCNEVIAEDEVVDDLEKSVDEIGMAVMVRFNPVATDLRRVISSMNIAGRLERIADHAVNVARHSRKILKTGPIEETKMLEPLFGLAIGEVRDAVTAYVDGNAELAVSVKKQDDELDRLHKRLGKSLIQLIEERTDGAVGLVHLMFVARSLERVGDLAKNIGEEVVFIESAEDIRHLSL